MSLGGVFRIKTTHRKTACAYLLLGLVLYLYGVWWWFGHWLLCHSGFPSGSFPVCILCEGSWPYVWTQAFLTPSITQSLILFGIQDVYLHTLDAFQGSPDSNKNKEKHSQCQSFSLFQFNATSCPVFLILLFAILKQWWRKITVHF